MSTPMSDAEKKKKSGKGELRETIVVIVQALLIALVFRTFAFEPFSIPTASMQSNLLIGDYILASKYSYGYSRYSLPYTEVPWRGRVFGREPERGDVAVFRPVPQSENYVKRVVGLPGDRVQVTGGILHINGEPVERERLGQGQDRDSNSMTLPVNIYRETLPNGVSYVIQEISDNAQFDNTQEYVVPPGHFFMMGDNRDRSLDSRSLSHVGFVPFENLLGKAEWRFFSIEDNIPPWQIWRWPGNVRFDRIFTSIYE
ncbi:signal peptidase I [Pelagibacterium limicola]|uniref:signal peptidase I n=1 Tax=Pelagibacterium limicola TaxID=2791022 RepID=UPI001FEB0026|nr:signal peptidase I [Pelagibacterium limicola]